MNFITKYFRTPTPDAYAQYQLTELKREYLQTQLKAELAFAQHESYIAEAKARLVSIERLEKSLKGK